MLIPDSEAAAHLGLLRRLESGHQGVPVSAFRYSTANATDSMFFADELGNWQIGPWASDARFLFCSISTDKVVLQFVICDGSYFEFSGRRIFDADLRVKQREWSRDTRSHLVSRPANTTTICELAAPKPG